MKSTEPEILKNSLREHKIFRKSDREEIGCNSLLQKDHKVLLKYVRPHAIRQYSFYDIRFLVNALIIIKVKL